MCMVSFRTTLAWTLRAKRGQLGFRKSHEGKSSHTDIVGSQTNGGIFLAPGGAGFLAEFVDRKALCNAGEERMRPCGRGGIGAGAHLREGSEISAEDGLVARQVSFPPFLSPPLDRLSGASLVLFEQVP